MSSLPTLPLELLERIYQFLAYSSDSMKMLSSYLTIDRTARSCLEPYLYRTVVISGMYPVSGHYLSRILRCLEYKSVPWLEQHVQHLYIGYGALSVWYGTSVVRNFSRLTRLACWLGIHESKDLAKAINDLSHLQMLEVTWNNFVFLLSMEKPFLPVWKDRLTHLSLRWDYLSDRTVHQLSLKGFSSLTHLAMNGASAPDLFCFHLLRNAPPSLSLLVVCHYTLDNIPLREWSFFMQTTFLQCGSDHRLVYFVESAVTLDINASSIAIQERPFLLQQDSAFDDWGQTPHSSNGSTLKIWSWATNAVNNGTRIFSRPTTSFTVSSSIQTLPI